MFSTTVSVHYFTKISLDLHDVLAFNTNFSNQWVRMKIKQSDIKNSKIHALVYINLCFHFSSGCLYPLKNCLKCSYTRYYVVFHESLDWSIKVCISILLIIFKLDLKLVYTTKTAMNRRFVTCFRDVTIHIIAVSRRLNSSNQYAFMVKKYRKCSFWKLSNRCLTMQYSVITTSPLCLYKAGHGPTDFLNCVNTTERRMKNLK